MPTTEITPHSDRSESKRVITEVNRLTNDFAQRIDNITNSLGNAGTVPQSQINDLHDIANGLRAIQSSPGLEGIVDRPTSANPALNPVFQRNTQPPLTHDRVSAPVDRGVRHDHQNGITSYDDGTLATDAAIGNGKAGPQGSQSGSR